VTNDSITIFPELISVISALASFPALALIVAATIQAVTAHPIGAAFILPVATILPVTTIIRTTVDRAGCNSAKQYRRNELVHVGPFVSNWADCPTAF
jgi:hypothetical protein